MVDEQKIKEFKKMGNYDKGDYILSRINIQTNFHGEPRDFKEESKHLIDSPLGKLKVNVYKRRITVSVCNIDIEMNSFIFQLMTQLTPSLKTDDWGWELALISNWGEGTYVG